MTQCVSLFCDMLSWLFRLRVLLEIHLVKSIVRSGLLLVALLSGYARAEQVLDYEPSVVKVSGKIAMGKFQHPNGESVSFYLLKLIIPASIEADRANLINASESEIKEIQLYSNDSKVRKKLDKLPGKDAIVKGTLFHSHTAWHIRPLVMNVFEVK